LRRAEAYRAAGCDGLFVPGLADASAIKEIVAAIGTLPLNIMAVPGLPPAKMLQTLGVRRFSAGAAIAQSAMSRARRLATDFLAGNDGELFTDAVEYGAANQLFEKA
jgi:2-methylisocitrate lyase-like PEP mutase family enzyme